MPIRFLHTADWQLGKPFAGITDDTKRHAVQAERFAVVERITSLAVTHDVAFVLIAGDVFDSPTPTRSLVSQFCSAVGRIGRPTFVIPGNHDHGGAGGIWTQPFFEKEAAALAPNLRVLLAAEPVVVGSSAVILPCPLLRRHENQDLSAWLRSLPGLPSEAQSLPRIVLAHGTIINFGGAGAATDDDEASASGVNHLDLGRLSPDDYDFIALGDWHGHMQVGPKAWYSGTPEPDRFPRGETNLPGHVLLVDADRGSAPKVTPICTGRLGWHDLAFTFREGAGIDAFTTEFESLVGNRTHSDLLRLQLDGALGLEEHARLAALRETLDARLLRLKEELSIAVQPTDDEVKALTLRSGEPLTVRVAETLVLQTSDPDPGRARVARAALRSLHLALRSAT